MRFLSLVLLFTALNISLAVASDNLKTEFKFRGSNVNGTVLNSAASTATVENEKVLKDMFSIRRDFKDKIRKSLRDEGVSR